MPIGRFSRVIFLIREEMLEQFEVQVGSKYLGVIEVEYAYQSKEDLPPGFLFVPSNVSVHGEPSHAVWAARSVLKDQPFAVINADDYYGAETFKVLFDSFEKMNEEERVRNRFSMVGFRLLDTLSDHGVVSRGICKESGGYLENVEEWTKIGGSPIVGMNSNGVEGSLDGSEIVSMNVWGFPPSVLDLLEKEFTAFLNTH